MLVSHGANVHLYINVPCCWFCLRSWTKVLYAVSTILFQIQGKTRSKMREQCNMNAPFGRAIFYKWGRIQHKIICKFTRMFYHILYIIRCKKKIWAFQLIHINYFIYRIRSHNLKLTIHILNMSIISRNRAISSVMNILSMSLYIWSCIQNYTIFWQVNGWVINLKIKVPETKLN